MMAGVRARQGAPAVLSAATVADNVRPPGRLPPARLRLEGYGHGLCPICGVRYELIAEFCATCKVAVPGPGGDYRSKRESSLWHVLIRKGVKIYYPPGTLNREVRRAATLRGGRFLGAQPALARPA